MIQLIYTLRRAATQQARTALAEQRAAAAQQPWSAGLSASEAGGNDLDGLLAGEEPAAPAVQQASQPLPRTKGGRIKSRVCPPPLLPALPHCRLSPHSPGLLPFI